MQMSDEIIPSKAQLPTSGAPTRIDINGGQNTVYGQIGTVQDNRSNVLIAGGQQRQQGMPMRTSWEFDYYNLFVIGGETFYQFSQGDFVVPKEDALMRFVAEDIAEEIQRLDKAAMDRVQGFFCIFAPRNADYAEPRNDQNALLGVITEIQRQDEEFKIMYQTLNPIPQAKANNDVVGAQQQKKEECKTAVWAHIVFILQSVISRFKTSLSQDLKNKAAQARRDSRVLAEEIAELNKQTVNTKAVIDSINALLRDSGFQGFSLREKVGVANVYEVIREEDLSQKT